MSILAELQLPELVEDLDLVTAPAEGGGYWLWLAAGVLAAIALAVPLYLALRRRRAALAEDGSAAPRPDPAIAARQRLGVLRAELASLSQREAAIELAAILRDYICDRFDIRAPYQTTTEFVQSLGIADHFPATRSDAVVELLRTTDLVKFATGILETQTIEQWIDYVAEFVETTTRDAASAQAAATAPADPPAEPPTAKRGES